MFEHQLLEQWRKEQGGNIHQMTNRGSETPAETLEYEPEGISNYEEKNLVPYIVDKIQIKPEFTIDKDIQTKARAVDLFIRTELNRDSTISYEVILDRLTGGLTEPLERMIQGKRNLEVLNHLFREVAIRDHLSGKSYLKIIREHLKTKQVENLKRQMKELINSKYA